VRVGGHYAVQVNSSSLILIPVESTFAAFILVNNATLHPDSYFALFPVIAQYCQIIAFDTVGDSRLRTRSR